MKHVHDLSTSSSSSSSSSLLSLLEPFIDISSSRSNQCSRKPHQAHLSSTKHRNILVQLWNKCKHVPSAFMHELVELASDSNNLASIVSSYQSLLDQNDDLVSSFTELLLRSASSDNSSGRISECVLRKSIKWSHGSGCSWRFHARVIALTSCTNPSHFGQDLARSQLRHILSRTKNPSPSSKCIPGSDSHPESLLEDLCQVAQSYLRVCDMDHIITALDQQCRQVDLHLGFAQAFSSLAVPGSKFFDAFQALITNIVEESLVESDTQLLSSSLQLCQCLSRSHDRLDRSSGSKRFSYSFWLQGRFLQTGISDQYQRLAVSAFTESLPNDDIATLRTHVALCRRLRALNGVRDTYLSLACARASLGDPNPSNSASSSLSTLNDVLLKIPSSSEVIEEGEIRNRICSFQKALVREPVSSANTGKVVNAFAAFMASTCPKTGQSCIRTRWSWIDEVAEALSQHDSSKDALLTLLRERLWKPENISSIKDVDRVAFAALTAALLKSRPASTLLTTFLNEWPCSEQIQIESLVSFALDYFDSLILLYPDNCSRSSQLFLPFRFVQKLRWLAQRHRMAHEDSDCSSASLFCSQLFRLQKLLPRSSSSSSSLPMFCSAASASFLHYAFEMAPSMPLDDLLFLELQIPAASRLSPNCNWSSITPDFLASEMMDSLPEIASFENHLIECMIAFSRAGSREKLRLLSNLWYEFADPSKGWLVSMCARVRSRSRLALSASLSVMSVLPNVHLHQAALSAEALARVLVEAGVQQFSSWMSLSDSSFKHLTQVYLSHAQSCKTLCTVTAMVASVPVCAAIASTLCRWPNLRARGLSLHHRIESSIRVLETIESEQLQAHVHQMAVKSPVLMAHLLVLEGFRSCHQTVLARLKLFSASRADQPFAKLCCVMLLLVCQASSSSSLTSFALQMAKSLVANCGFWLVAAVFSPARPQACTEILQSTEDVAFRSKTLTDGVRRAIRFEMSAFLMRLIAQLSSSRAVISSNTLLNPDILDVLLTQYQVYMQPQTQLQLQPQQQQQHQISRVHDGYLASCILAILRRGIDQSNSKLLQTRLLDVISSNPACVSFLEQLFADEFLLPYSPARRAPEPHTQNEARKRIKR